MRLASQTSTNLGWIIMDKNIQWTLQLFRTMCAAIAVKLWKCRGTTSTLDDLFSISLVIINLFHQWHLFTCENCSPHSCHCRGVWPFSNNLTHTHIHTHTYTHIYIIYIVVIEFLDDLHTFHFTYLCLFPGEKIWD